MPVLKSNAAKCSCGGRITVLLVSHRLLAQCHSCMSVRGNPANDKPGHPRLQGQK